MRLGDVAYVRSGLVLARKQAKGITPHQYKLLNLRAIDNTGDIEMNELETFHASEVLNPEYLTHSGDVIVRLSIPYTAVIVDESMQNIVIPSSFAIIRADKRKVLPEYLHWLLNTPKVRQQIYENTTGNMLGSIKPSYFNDFRIELLPLAEQKKVSDLNALARREVKLLTELAKEKNKYYSQMIDRIQSEMRKGNKL